MYIYISIYVILYIIKILLVLGVFLANAQFRKEYVMNTIFMMMMMITMMILWIMQLQPSKMAMNGVVEQQ